MKKIILSLLLVTSLLTNQSYANNGFCNLLEKVCSQKNINLDAFSEAVKNLLLDKNAQTRLSKNARTKAEQFSWENVKPQWNKLLV